MSISLSSRIKLKRTIIFIFLSGYQVINKVQNTFCSCWFVSMHLRPNKNSHWPMSQTNAGLRELISAMVLLNLEAASLPRSIWTSVIKATSKSQSSRVLGPVIADVLQDAPRQAIAESERNCLLSILSFTFHEYCHGIGQHTQLSNLAIYFVTHLRS